MDKLDLNKVLKYPVSTEKAIRMIQNENKITFVVERKATKAEIKKAVEEIFKVKVAKVNTLSVLGKPKKAYIKLAKGYSAADLSADLGMI